MAPRSGARVKIVSPHSGKVTTSRSISVAPSDSASSSCAYDGGRDMSESSLPPTRPRGNNPAGTNAYVPARMARSATLCENVSGGPHGTLRDVDVNVSCVSKSVVQGKRSLSCTVVPPSSRQTMSRDGAHSHRNGAAPSRRSLLNYFAEVDKSSAAAAVTRGAQRHLSERSTSHSSHSFHRDKARPGREEAPRLWRQQAEDEEALRRATAALEHAGRTLWRRPFGGGKGAEGIAPSNSSSSGDAKTNGDVPHVVGNTSSLPRSSPQPGSGGLQLPPSLPFTTHTRCPRSRDSDRSEYSSMGSTASSHKRSRSWADASLTSRPRAPRVAPAATNTTTTTTVQPQNGFDSTLVRNASLASSPYSFYKSFSSIAPAQQTPPAAVACAAVVPHVCAGMFRGVSAVPLNEKLFADAYPTHLQSLSSSASVSAAALSGPPRRVAAVVDTQQRYCVRPLWSLVGTFKTSLSALVTLDLPQECLRWSQRNPKGGQQLIKIPLATVIDVFTTRVVQADANVEERQFTLVVRTSTRPSQVVFGFATAAEGNRLRSVLKAVTK